jgi:cytochrome c oxidase subunit II
MRLAKKTTLLLSGFAVAAAAMVMGTAMAVAQTGVARDWQLGFQEAATPTMVWIEEFHTLILWIITAIVLFVLALLIIVMVRFNAKSNPVPSKTTHNTFVEVAWTLIPILILLVIAVPSFRLLYFDRTIPDADLTIKAIGNQWYWSYEYPDADGMTFDSLMVEDADLKEGQPRLLAVDNDVVVPVGKNVRVIVTATDVIHNWAIPAFGMKMDAIPGRLNEAWFRADKTGIFYGQCSELCGQRHAFMPIAVRVVSEADYAEWLEKAKQEFASAPAAAQVARVAQ